MEQLTLEMLKLCAFTTQKFEIFYRYLVKGNAIISFAAKEVRSHLKYISAALSSVSQKRLSFIY